ncbi:uncharacterized protein FSUBG_8464 [Fusarium subglutinans]|uniref:Uncharacterized protein n=1 Tax=Gibberella subglutinans TaxID=42677 RepID=A0A8H5USM5_GIBSU|nr:uncharacterized protein FSUBG_8464 [Fusarium subglutinans]KAF5597632.1 hypothetical protein FSUBG_8464 [Fusarium subglutinans]
MRVASTVIAALEEYEFDLEAGFARLGPGESSCLGCVLAIHRSNRLVCVIDEMETCCTWCAHNHKKCTAHYWNQVDYETTVDRTLTPIQRWRIVQCLDRRRNWFRPSLHRFIISHYLREPSPDPKTIAELSPRNRNHGYSPCPPGGNTPDPFEPIQPSQNSTSVKTNTRQRLYHKALETGRRLVANLREPTTPYRVHPPTTARYTFEYSEPKPRPKDPKT